MSVALLTAVRAELQSNETGQATALPLELELESPRQQRIDGGRRRDTRSGRSHLAGDHPALLAKRCHQAATQGAAQRVEQAG